MKKEICNLLIILFGLSGIYFLYVFDVIGVLSCLIWIAIIYYIKSRSIKKNFLTPAPLSQTKHLEYVRKSIMTANEFAFFNKIKDLEGNYIIIPQVNLASIIYKKNAKYYTELFRNIDFGIFDKNYNLLLLIELNDRTHEQLKRKDRDLKVRKILQECNIPLLTFYTYYPNEKNYVLNRIMKILDARS